MIDFSGILCIDAEKIKNKGEDAIISKFDEHGNGYIFVFDGCGGAGSEKHPDLGQEKSAYIASRSCALFFEHYYESIDFSDTKELSRQLHSYLVKVNKHYPMESSESTLVDVLQTTISGAVVKVEEDKINAKFIWAGDSRGYIIDEFGLSQVTEDDVNSEDAYRNLSDDAIMINRIHGNQNKELFKIHSAEIELHEKGIIICATDGCYDYFNSPMVFEFFIVTMLFMSDSFSQAESRILDVLNEKSGDDCSMIAAFYGFSHYSEIKKFLQERFEILNGDKVSSVKRIGMKPIKITITGIIN